VPGALRSIPWNNPWVRAGFVLFGAVSLALFLFDVGLSWGNFPGTRGYIVFIILAAGLNSILVAGFLLEKGLARLLAPKRIGPSVRIRPLGAALGIVLYGILFLSAILLAFLVLLQSLGVTDPNSPLPLIGNAFLVGALIAICIRVGLGLPSWGSPR